MISKTFILIKQPLLFRCLTRAFRTVFTVQLVCIVFLLALLAADSVAAVTIVDYDDNNESNGVHDAELLSGGFTSSSSFAWQSIGSNAASYSATGGDSLNDMGGRNYVSANNRLIAMSTAYTVLASDTFNMSYHWSRRTGFDNGDSISMVLFTTVDDSMTGVDHETVALTRQGSDSAAEWNVAEQRNISLNNSVGKTLYIRLENHSDRTSEFARFDNVFLEAQSVPELSTFCLLAPSMLLVLLRRSNTTSKK